MFQIRLHGRGGQGVVTSAEMLSLAAFTEGHYAQAFPSFGSERTGAPVVAFARVSDKPIRLREPIMEPDAVLIQDRTLLESVNVFSGLTENAYVLLNSSQSPEELGLEDLVNRLPKGHVITLPATKFALARIGRPLPGAAMLAGFAALNRQTQTRKRPAGFPNSLQRKSCPSQRRRCGDAYSFVLEAKNRL